MNWNSTDYIRESVKSIYEFTSQYSFEIIVVDNASSDGDLSLLQKEFPKIVLIESDKNLGFAGANNLGFTHSAGDYVLFLNPDTRLLNPAIDIMIGYARSLPDAGILGCKLLNRDSSIQLSSIQRFPTILNQVLSIAYLQSLWPACPLWSLGPLFSEAKTLTRVDVISGACILVGREVFQKAGMFSEDYFMYAEDIDLNYKVRKAGYTNYFVAEARIMHYGGGSSSQAGGEWKSVMMHRAMLLYYRKTKGPAYPLMYRIAMASAASGRLLLLGLAYPLGGLMLDRQRIRTASSKWKAVLGWAIGRVSQKSEWSDS